MVSSSLFLVEMNLTVELLDGLVKSDKIGVMKYISRLSSSASVNWHWDSFYWCFPSDVGQSLVNKEEKLKDSVEALTKELEIETAIVELEKDERVDSVSYILSSSSSSSC